MYNRKYRLGLIGLGKMGLAIARGAVVTDYLERHEVCVFDVRDNIASICKEESFALMGSVKEVAQNADIVLLAVRPQDLDGVLEELKGEKIECILSIVTGLSIAKIQEELNDVPVIRGMPNTPLQIKEGATALCMSGNCCADDYDFVYKLFASMGETRTIREDQMNDIIVVHGSTPAYFYYFIECLMEDAKSRGIDEDVARALLVQTMIGSGELLLKDRNKPIQDYIEEVCSKGGATYEAIEVMRHSNLQDIFHEASDACIKRAEEMSK